MAIGSVLGFWGLSFLLVLTPGADWAYMIRAGLRGRAVLPSLAGLLVGHLALVALVAAGVAALVARRPEVLAVLTVLGAAYLVWLGVGGLLRPAGPAAVTVDGSGSRIGEAVRGAGVSGLNPKVLLLFLAVLPQFTDPGGGWSLGFQILLLGLVHVVGCAAVYAGVGVGARAVLAARPAAARVVSRCSGPRAPPRCSSATRRDRQFALSRTSVRVAGYGRTGARPGGPVVLRRSVRGTGRSVPACPPTRTTPPAATPPAATSLPRTPPPPAPPSPSPTTRRPRCAVPAAR